MRKEITFIIPNMTETTLYFSYDIKKQKENLEKKIQKLVKEHNKLFNKLINPDFIINAPLPIFNNISAKFNNNLTELKNLCYNLNELKGEMNNA